MDIVNLYNELNAIFTKYTTHQWKNGWEHEGDRDSKELTIQKRVKNNNLFLLQRKINEITLDGPGGFMIRILKSPSPKHGRFLDSEVSIDIEGGMNADIDIFYRVNNQSDWLDHSEFIINLCRNIYNANVLIRESISEVPNDIYGGRNPKFAKKYRRERQLDELLSA